MRFISITKGNDNVATASVKYENNEASESLNADTLDSTVTTAVNTGKDTRIEVVLRQAHQRSLARTNQSMLPLPQPYQFLLLPNFLLRKPVLLWLL